jgi:Xaa-Pro aminopeptidase
VLSEYECRLQGAQRPAYPPVVASGADALTIHYSRADKRLASGQLLLMDAGCELHGYCSDVTRTWPVSGSFSPAQKAVYEAVLEVRCCQAA